MNRLFGFSYTLGYVYHLVVNPIQTKKQSGILVVVVVVPGTHYLSLVLYN